MLKAHQLGLSEGMFEGRVGIDARRYHRGAVVGRRRRCPVHLLQRPRSGRYLGDGDRRAEGQLVPQVHEHRHGAPAGRLLPHGAGGGLGRRQHLDDRRPRRRRLHPQRDEALHHQRRHRRRPRGLRDGGQEQEVGRPLRLRHREGHAGPLDGHRLEEDGHPGLPHRRRHTGRLPGARREPAGAAAGRSAGDRRWRREPWARWAPSSAPAP